MEMNGGMENCMFDLINKRAASDLLEDALQHFDHIIDGASGAMGSNDDKFRDEDQIENELDNGVEGVALLMEDLRNAVEAAVDVEVDDDIGKAAFSESLLKHISSDTISFYRKLLRIQTNESESEKMTRLLAENESLSLHVSVLTDQVELQTEKIEEMEEQLKEALVRMEGADARLQEEVKAKTRLETEKLELMNEMSKYKIERVQIQQQQQQEKVEAKESERRRSESEARSDQYKELVEELRKSIAAKDQTLSDLRREMKVLKQSAATPPAVQSPDEGFVPDHNEKVTSEPLQLRMPAPYATSTPISTDTAATNSGQFVLNEKPQGGAQASSPAVTPTGIHPGVKIRSSSLEKLRTVTSQRPVDVVTSVKDDPPLGGSSVQLSRAGDSPDASKPTQSWQNNKSTKSSSTPNLALTERGLLTDAPKDESLDTPTREHPPSFHHRKKHGFRKFFSSFRLRRSKSTSLEPGAMTSDLSSSKKEPSNFERGGYRATAGPRLGWNPRDHVVQSKSPLGDDVPFQRWDTERVCQWMTDIGLEAYTGACRRWVKSGDTLLRATNHELEKELGIRHPIHKKKLMLHLHALAGSDDDDVAGAAQMNSIWVARWLDDVGLPQYKDAFHEACVDGRVLHHLTVSDAHKLKISNLVHLISLRRGIERLRSCQFDPARLKRRPVDDDEKEDVTLWTNHRVMEWLRMADLAEYAPNLRGSGVHGALMVYEPMFTSDLLSSLLNIPINKSLLRRHLAAKLDELLPEESNHAKKERAKEPGHQPLNVGVKFKVGRRSFGGFGRFRVGSSAREFGSGEYVCPMSSSMKSMASHRVELERKMKMEEMKEKRSSGADKEEDQNFDNADVAEMNETTTRELNAFSTQMNTLTSNWTEG